METEATNAMTRVLAGGRAVELEIWLIDIITGKVCKGQRVVPTVANSPDWQTAPVNDESPFGTRVPT